VLRVVVVGVGVVGVVCVYYGVWVGFDVIVFDCGVVVLGIISCGEGNILVFDKVLGLELELVLFLVCLWCWFGCELLVDVELEFKGGVVVVIIDFVVDLFVEFVVA